LRYVHESFAVDIRLWMGTRRLSENREPAAEKPFRPFFLLIFVKYNPYSPQISEKNDSKWLSLATPSILGQAPS